MDAVTRCVVLTRGGAMGGVTRCAALMLGLALATAPAAAQTVGGSVRDEGSGAAVAGATVSLQQVDGPGRAGAITDASGAFLLPLAARSARYVIRVEHPSYLPFADTLELRSQEAVTLELRLGRDAIPLQPLVVSGRIDRRLQGYHERLSRGGGFGRFVTRSEMDRLAAIRATDYLRRVPGVRVDRVNGGSMVTMNNPLGNCTPLVFIDGIPLEQRAPDEVDDRLDPAMLEGIEVYPGLTGLPLEFASAQPTGCGVVAFWTREPAGRPMTWAKVLFSAAAVFVFALGSWKIML
jgi:hypothetical protein